MPMPLLPVEVLFFTCLYNDNHLLGDWAQYPAVCNFVVNVIMDQHLINCIQFMLCCHTITIVMFLVNIL